MYPLTINLGRMPTDHRWDDAFGIHIVDLTAALGSRETMAVDRKYGEKVTRIRVISVFLNREVVTFP